MSRKPKDASGEGDALRGRDEDGPSLVLHEEELLVDKRLHEVGVVRARKRVEHETVEEIVPRETEYADVERAEPGDGDSGEIETLPDGSISVPIFEEEIVVSKRLVVRERVVIRKRTTSEQQRVSAELRKEREVDTEGDAELES